MRFNDLIAGVKADGEGGYTAHVPDSWMQGRTIYGGLSAALCLEATRLSFPETPPLRSAQVSFVGPAGGDISLRAEILRQGRSVTFANADLIGEKGVATRCTFCCGAPRDTIFDLDDVTMPDVPGPNDSENFFAGGVGPSFAANFDCRLAVGARPISGSDVHDHYMWVRFKDPATGPVALLALGDMPPPAILSRFPEPKPISSMTWIVNMLVDSPQTDDGWWLLRSRAEHARDGYSSQDMYVWNTGGQPIITGRQNVAIFI